MKRRNTKTTPRVLVTGGALRIGREICLAFARKGFDVIVHYRQSGAEARSLVKEMQSQGVNTWAVSGRVDTEAGCRKIVADAWKVSGGFTVLVNNASVFEMRELIDTDWVAMRRNFEANLFGPVCMSVEFSRRLAAGGSVQGCVVNLLDRRIASDASDAAAYSLSRKALADFTRMAALAFAPGVRVNAVAPGAVLPARGMNVTTKKAEFKKNPLGRPVSVEEIAASVVFLAEAESLTGQVVFVDGGRFLEK